MVKLTDVFLIREASMHAWKNLGYAPEVKAYFEQMFGNIAYEMGILYARRFKTMKAHGRPDGRVDLQIAKDDLPESSGSWHVLIKFQRALKSPKFAAIVRKNAASLMNDDGVYTWRDLEADANDMSPAPEKYDQLKTVVEVGDGWKWVQVDDQECQDYEGTLMQHCGQAWGGMLSLRDPQGKPHVTAEVSESPDRVDQLKGKQNDVVAEKYWEACAVLFKKLAENSHYGETFVFNDPMYWESKLGEEFMIFLKERGLAKLNKKRPDPEPFGANF